MAFNALPFNILRFGLGRFLSEAYGMDNNTSTPGIDSFTTLMLHLNNNVTDSETAGAAKTVTNVNATFSSTTYKFGGFAAIFNGSNAYLSTPNAASLNPGTGDFTIDCWVYSTDFATGGCLFVKGDATTDMWEFDPAGTGEFRVRVGGVSIADYTFSGAALTNSTWHHLAVVRNGTTVFVFIDGVSIALTTLAAIASQNIDNTGVFYIGARKTNNDLFFNCIVDEFRFSKGIARWTSNFTPPTSEYV